MKLILLLSFFLVAIFFSCSSSIYSENEKLKIENFVNYTAQNFKHNYNQSGDCEKNNLFGDSSIISNSFVQNKEPYYVKFFMTSSDGISCEKILHNKIDIPFLNAIKFKRDIQEISYDLDMSKFDMGSIPIQVTIHKFETELLVEGKFYRGMIQFSNDYYKNDNYQNQHKFVLELFYFFE